MSVVSLFTKENKHFLTIQYATGSEGNYRECLAAIEATLGKKVERIEEH